MHSATVWRFTPLAMATGLSLMPLAASKRMAAGSTCRFSALRDRRRSSSLSRSAADRLNGCRFVTNGINHSATQMFLLGSFQQNANVVSKKPYDQFLAERIFAPLRMTDTYFFVPADKQKRVAAVYT